MPKLKTKRGAAKRFKKTATGKICRRRAGHSHILTSKDRKRKRNLRKGTLIAKVDEKHIRRQIPYA